jgi:hypothetical protein
MGSIISFLSLKTVSYPPVCELGVAMGFFRLLLTIYAVPLMSIRVPAVRTSARDRARIPAVVHIEPIQFILCQLIRNCDHLLLCNAFF